MPRTTYAFERLSPELESPPFAAIRALRAAGVRLSRDGWLSLPREARTALAELGTAEIIDPNQVRFALSGVVPREISLWQQQPEPSVAQVPEAVINALGPAGKAASSFWQAVSPLDRFVLLLLSHNPRLLLHAITEIALRTRQLDFVISLKGWSGTLAHCEVGTTQDVAAQLVSRQVLDGQALVLSRVAGVRAARRACAILDLHRDTVTGAIEIGALVRHEGNAAAVLWQAHVSTVAGAFFPSASVLAVTAAAAALYDIIAYVIGGTAVIGAGALVSEPWCVGWEDGDATAAANV